MKKEMEALKEDNEDKQIQVTLIRANRDRFVEINARQAKVLRKLRYEVAKKDEETIKQKAEVQKKTEDGELFARDAQRLKQDRDEVQAELRNLLRQKLEL
uniref:Uncharacterized protein n=1 Tax=Panagrolaimus davidi TaxID=227884 RepID=A0A914Q7P9_9BILA